MRYEKADSLFSAQLSVLLLWVVQSVCWNKKWACFDSIKVDVNVVGALIKISSHTGHAHAALGTFWGTVLEPLIWQLEAGIAWPCSDSWFLTYPCPYSYTLQCPMAAQHVMEMLACTWTHCSSADGVFQAELAAWIIMLQDCSRAAAVFGLSTHPKCHCSVDTSVLVLLL